jgi:alginate O-acetyltransferase complex protein AlgI
MTLYVGCLAALLMVCAGMFVRNYAAKQLLLLAGSYVFYQFWGLSFLAVLIASSIVNFYLGVWLRRHPGIGWLWVGIIFNVLALSFYKYVPAFSAAPDFFQHIAMPAGMSFWTFQALSYLFDVYHEDEMDPTLLEFCLYMAFWPTVLMGPICRLPKMLPQFRKTGRFVAANVESGSRRIVMGLFMKLVLAQILGPVVNRSFDQAGKNWGGLDVWLLAVGFGFQLFFDFAGYSNIVIGAAKMFGFQLEENFNSPYRSSSPSMFWTRWHMSLSSWIRDYVFVPMAALFRSPSWRYVVLVLSMALFGLWHGAKVTFVLWGICQGILLALHRLVLELQRRFKLKTGALLDSFGGWIVTFVGITLGWVLFRANDLHQAAVMYGAILSAGSYRKTELPLNYYRALIVLVAGYFALRAAMESRIFHRISASFQIAEENPGFLRLCWGNLWWAVAPPIVMLIIVAVLVLSRTATVTPFMYSAF